MLKPCDKQTVDTYLMEMSKGQFLRINATEDGNGTKVRFTMECMEGGTK